MRFLVDECTGPRTASWLREEGHEVFSVFDEARGSDDDTILDKAWNENWILITNDRDFSEKVFKQKHPHHGVIFLRLTDNRTTSKIEVLKRLLDSYSEELPDKFVVVTETQIRFSRA